ncbi:MAG: 4-alpha-glucanotransferase [Chloroflexi bacterium]|nr:4-alpha-glucanotransferase [Chloroflexota bacterium]
MKFPRRSGVVLHPTSLPGPYGIGDLGAPAFDFVDWLVQAGQSYWQVLPLSPTGYGDSPYQGLSAFAGNPMLISPEKLLEVGHLHASDLENLPAFPRAGVDFGWIISWKMELLQRAYTNFKTRGTRVQRAAFEQFMRDNAAWLDDAALFLALKETHDRRAWYDWEPEIRSREPAAMAQAQKTLADEIARQKYLQWMFYEQWLALKAYANARDIDIIGDIPIYVARDCCDVWANPHLFALDADLNPTLVSGVPPDYFSEDGQFWGHPLYRWDVMEREGYGWWIERFRSAFTQCDVVRIDHFRAFYNYWEVPATAKTAREGKWKYGAGGKLFHAVNAALGDDPRPLQPPDVQGSGRGSGVRIIAEDLGDFDAASRAGLDALLQEFSFPGMKILQFAFGGTAEAAFLPHNYTREWVVYTGTHDNDTAVGWWNSANEYEKHFTRKYLNTSAHDIAWDLIRAAWMSVANTAMTTAQDILHLGNEARMNLPGVLGPPNWCWRMRESALTRELAERLLDMTQVYARVKPAKPASVSPETETNETLATQA